MKMLNEQGTSQTNRRQWIHSLASGIGGVALGGMVLPSALCAGPIPKKPTRFQIACMTLPYARFSLERALTGIREAGYEYVAWGTTHQEQPDEKTSACHGCGCFARKGARPCCTVP